MEKYLSDHRDDLDVENPDDNIVWQNIQNELLRKRQAEKRAIRKLMLIRVRNIAAGILLVFSLGYIANDIINGRTRNSEVTLSSINYDLGVREKEYKTLVSFKTEEVSSFTGSHDIIIRELFSEIAGVDTVYNQAMNDLKKLGPNVKVINTIFNTYEQKIRLLELIILETNKQSSHENDKKIIL